jgi:hypothetical protein
VERTLPAGDLMARVGMTIEKSWQVACTRCATDDWARAWHMSRD